MNPESSDWAPFAPASVADPVGTDRAMRQTCPVAYSDDAGGFYALFKYDDIVAALGDRDTFISKPTIGVPVPAPGTPPLVPLQADLPEHRFFRKLLIPFFVQSRIATFEAALRDMTNELIDSFIGRGRVDIAKELCLALTARAICLLMGLPPEDWKLIRDWTETSIDALAIGDTQRALGSHREMADYGQQHLESRRTNPSGDVLSAMLSADIGGRPMTEEELRGMFVLVLQAGHETTANALGATIKYLAQHPDSRRRMREDPDALAGAIEEFLRYTAPVRGLARTTTRDVEIRGRFIPAGSQVAMMFSSGSRDEDVFQNPDECDFSRDASNHMTFGRGIHRCLGEHLARLEMRVVLEELLRRIPEFELDGDDAPAMWPVIGHRSLPIRF